MTNSSIMEHLDYSESRQGLSDLRAESRSGLAEGILERSEML
jgi:hypothetical protein